MKPLDAIRILNSAGGALFAQARLHRQLVRVEWEEEKVRLLKLLVAALLGLAGLLCFMLFAGIAVLASSWDSGYRIPVAVILVVPIGVLGALLAVTLRDLPNDVYFKVGLIVIIGLAAKNAILIIQFARNLQDKGQDLIEATLEACRLRLRPILMTSIAFVLGVLPLAISTGAGANGRHAIGTGVMGGMIAATVIAIFLVPVFYVVIRRIFPGHKRQPHLEHRRPQEDNHGVS